ncbi:MAG: apolipoprotein N-acyltransferase [Verrucomicrobiota bacterium]
MSSTSARDLTPWLWALVALPLFAWLMLSAFPNFDVAESAYVCLLPVLLWAATKPPSRLFAIGTLLASWVFWFFLLIWLRHLHPPMGWVANVILSLLLAVFFMVWFLAARWMLPKVLDASFRLRLISFCGLGGLWVVFEWMRTWFFFGFPWAMLGVSQWQRPPLLQVAEFTGAYGVSFILIFFNLALTSYFWRLLRPILPGAQAPEVPAPEPETAPEPEDAPEGEEEARRPYRSLGRSLLHSKSKRQQPMTNAMSLSGAMRFDRSMMQGFGRFFKISPELYLALAMVLGSLWLFSVRIPDQTQTEPLFRAGVVQPWTIPTLKWDPNHRYENLMTLATLTEAVSVSEPDVILWPEAATPIPLNDPNDEPIQPWVEHVASRANAPILTGNLAYFNGELLNAIVVFNPDNGLQAGFYAKQKRVPFGEFVPFRELLPFLGKVVPIDDIAAGKASTVLPLVTRGELYKVGPLVCYEDIFPHITRELLLNGADVLAVVTNDAWYGQEAGATQHAAHSVMRAVETRRPVVRCGNHGWSGWIDEYGRIREYLVGLNGSIYVRGTDTFTLTRDTRWVSRQTVYVKYGDWFVVLGGLLFAWAWWRLRLKVPR